MFLAFLKIVGLVLLIYGMYCFAVEYFKFLTNPIHKSIPGPSRKTFLFGNFRNVLESTKYSFMEGTIKIWKELSEKEGKTIPMVATHVLLGYIFIWVMDPDVVKEIMIAPSHKDPSLTEKRYILLTKVLGNGLLTLEGSSWHRHRRILQPSFHAAAIQQSVCFSAWQRTQELILVWKSTDFSRNIDILAHMSALTLDTIGDVAFGHDFRALDGVKQWASDPSKVHVTETADPLINAFQKVLQFRILDLLAIMFKMEWLFYFNPQLPNLVKILDKEVDNVIRLGRENTDKAEEHVTGKKTRRSMLQLMFDAEDMESTTAESKRLMYNEVRDELKTFIYVGHDTTSVATHWAFYCLGKYPDIQQKVYDDICKHTTKDDDVNLKSLEKMTYFLAFLNEVLRMFPPVGFIGRVTTKDVTWMGYSLPKESRVSIPIYFLHRHPDHWDKPNEFLPERWLDVEATKKRHPFAYIPFSAGGRNCIGQSFALTETKMIVSLILRNFKITLPDHMKDRDLFLVNIATLKNNPTIEICVKPR